MSDHLCAQVGTVILVMRITIPTIVNEKIVSSNIIIWSSRSITTTRSSSYNNNNNNTPVYDAIITVCITNNKKMNAIFQLHNNNNGSPVYDAVSVHYYK